MSRLLRVELTRFFSRRAVALLLIAVALFTGVAAGKTLWDTRAPSSSDRATAQAQADLAANAASGEIQECRHDPASYLGPGKTTADCRRELVPSARDLLPRHPLSLGRVLNGTGVHLAVLVIAVLVIAAATYAGADWASGSLATQLVFEPRRPRMWLAKSVVVVLAAGVVTAVLLAAFWGAMFTGASARGVDVSHDLAATIGWHVGRAVLLAMGAALGSYALTMLFRHTVATLAVLFTYAAGGEVLINLIPIHGASRWSVGNNIFGWLKDHFSYVDPGVGCGPHSDCNAARFLSHGDAAWFLAALLVVAVVPSLLTFLRRDV